MVDLEAYYVMIGNPMPWNFCLSSVIGNLACQGYSLWLYHPLSTSPESSANWAYLIIQSQDWSQPTPIRLLPKSYIRFGVSMVTSAVPP